MLLLIPGQCCRDHLIPAPMDDDRGDAHALQILSSILIPQ